MAYVIHDNTHNKYVSNLHFSDNVIHGYSHHSDVNQAYRYDTHAQALRHVERLGDIFGGDLYIVDLDEPSADDSIQPAHYNKGSIDLYESWYRTRPFNEVRAILESIAERYIKRDKNDRVEDIEKAIYTLERLKEYEIKNKEESQ